LATALIDKVPTPILPEIKFDYQLKKVDMTVNNPYVEKQIRKIQNLSSVCQISGAQPDVVVDFLKISGKRTPVIYSWYPLSQNYKNFIENSVNKAAANRKMRFFDDL
jgi:hypothetical protein